MRFASLRNPQTDKKIILPPLALSRSSLADARKVQNEIIAALALTFTGKKYVSCVARDRE